MPETVVIQSFERLKFNLNFNTKIISFAFGMNKIKFTKPIKQAETFSIEKIIKI